MRGVHVLPGAVGADGHELLWHSSGQVMCFNADGLLVSQADRNNNVTAFSCNDDGQETQVAYTPNGASSPTETVAVTWIGCCWA